MSDIFKSAGYASAAKKGRATGASLTAQSQAGVGSARWPEIRSAWFNYHPQNIFKDTYYLAALKHSANDVLRVIYYSSNEGVFRYSDGNILDVWSIIKLAELQVNADFPLRHLFGPPNNSTP